jgi:hypothetical protein
LSSGGGRGTSRSRARPTNSDSCHGTQGGAIPTVLFGVFLTFYLYLFIFTYIYSYLLVFTYISLGAR